MRQTPPRRAHARDDPPDALVDGLDGPIAAVEHARMAHHVAVGEVQDDEVERRPAVDAAQTLVGDLVGAHLGLQVVGRHLGERVRGRGLPGKALDAAVEEEGTCAYFSVSAMRSCAGRLGQDLGQTCSAALGGKATGRGKSLRVLASW